MKSNNYKTYFKDELEELSKNIIPLSIWSVIRNIGVSCYCALLWQQGYHISRSWDSIKNTFTTAITHKNNYNLEIATFWERMLGWIAKIKPLRIAIYTFVLQPCCLYCCILFIIFWQWSKNMFYLAFNDISRNWWQKNDSWWQNFSRKQILDILSWLAVATIKLSF